MNSANIQGVDLTVIGRVLIWSKMSGSNPHSTDDKTEAPRLRDKQGLQERPDGPGWALGTNTPGSEVQLGRSLYLASVSPFCKVGTQQCQSHRVPIGVGVAWAP